ncbi:hypothetical protein [Enterococcus larvae]|uniref:hypothetical protein n=1 Tax=Enterococcus larvae TaxID=2794352 RepID=UPI003F37049F
MSEKIYPEWVQAQKTKGTTVKKVGQNYYLYKHTSKRVPGKKYPQPVDTYIGVITPDGIIRSGKKKFAITEVEVKEYGFSKAVWELCPQNWKKPLDDDWKDILAIIIMKWSPNSYISKELLIRKEEEFHYQFAAQMASLSRKIYKEYGVTMEELHHLDDIFLVYLEKETVVSKISEDQRKLLEKIPVNLEVC